MWVNDKILTRKSSGNDSSWAANKLLPNVLKGNYPQAAISKMGSERLECFVTRLVKCTAEFAYRKNKKAEVKFGRPKWWPSELAFNHPISILRNQAPYSMNWNAILRKLISECSQFYKGEPLAALKCRGRLYYYMNVFGTNENYENVQNRGVKRKAPLSDCRWANPKKQKSSGSDKTGKKVLSEKTTSNVTPVVRLCDILKTRPLEEETQEPISKDGFMHYMQLKGQNSVIKKRVSCSKPYNPRLIHVPHIPFSSEAGRLLIEKESQPVPQEVHLRKIERIEWHLKNEHAAKPSTSTQQYEVSYDERRDYQYAHKYKIPKRQFYQRHPTLHEAPFLLSLCRKRISVKVKNDDLHDLKRRLLIKKELYVKVENIDVSNYIANVQEDPNETSSEETEEENNSVVVVPPHKEITNAIVID